MIIYKITNMLNGKIYIGQTAQSLRQRWNEHCCKNSGCVHLHNAILKYGKENFAVEQIDIACDKEELNAKEINWIKYYNSTDKKIGYNILQGGGGMLGWKPSKEWIAKQRKLNSGKNNPMYGKHINLKKVVCVETGQVFNSIREASVATGASASGISRVCMKRPKYKTCGGFHWRYAK